MCTHACWPALRLQLALLWAALARRALLTVAAADPAVAWPFRSIAVRALFSAHESRTPAALNLTKRSTMAGRHVQRH